MQPKTSAREKLLAVAINMVRQRGYEATTVEALCTAAGVTKGAFFHHFASKERLGEAAAQAFSDMANGLFATASYTHLADPYDRLMGYIDFRFEILQGEIPEFTCYLGTLVQETYDTHPALREVADKHISAHAHMVAQLVEAARSRLLPEPAWTAESLAYHTQAVLQGGFILAKAKADPAIARETLLHLKRYVAMLFGKSDTRH